jgi:hypothetical protein
MKISRTSRAWAPRPCRCSGSWVPWRNTKTWGRGGGGGVCAEKCVIHRMRARGMHRKCWKHRHLDKIQVERTRRQPCCLDERACVLGEGMTLVGVVALPCCDARVTGSSGFSVVISSGSESGDDCRGRDIEMKIQSLQDHNSQAQLSADTLLCKVIMVTAVKKADTLKLYDIEKYEKTHCLYPPFSYRTSFCPFSCICTDCTTGTAAALQLPIGCCDGWHRLCN